MALRFQCLQRDPEAASWFSSVFPIPLKSVMSSEIFAQDFNRDCRVMLAVVPLNI